MTPRQLSTDAADHATGLVFRETDTGPQTHVLVVGVGSYPWSDLAELTSPAVSARAVADWFLGFGETQFNNDRRPLGSLAILLSEPVDGGKPAAKPLWENATSVADYRGIAVPRPDVATTQRALEAWRDRVVADPGNMAVVYVCGHGLSETGRCAFILADYGREAKKPYRGLIDVDDFIKTMATLSAPAQMLFFDCCRSDVPLGLQPGVQIGDRLLDPAGPRHLDIGQIALFATIMSKDAGGRTNATSLFAASLLVALDVGAVPRSAKWVVRSGGLYDVVGECLALYGRSTNEVQKADGELSGSFDIHYPVFSKDIRTFISLDDPALWTNAKITLNRIDEAGGVAAFRCIDGQNTPDPFYGDVLPSGDVFGFAADIAGRHFVLEPSIVGPPVMFAKLEARPSAKVSVASQTATRGLQHPRHGAGTVWTQSYGDDRDHLAHSWKALAGAGLDIGVSAPLSVEGAVVAVDPLFAIDDMDIADRAVAIGGEPTFVALPPGSYRAAITLPDGRRLSRTVALEPADHKRIDFDIGTSPREFLIPAFVAGLVAPLGSGAPGDPAKRWVEGDIAVRAVAALSWSGKPSDAPFDPGCAFDLRTDDRTPERYGLATAQDGLPIRFKPRPEAELFGAPLVPKATGRPLWADISIGAVREICFVPSIGVIGNDQDWHAQIVIDRQGRAGRTHAAAFVGSSAFAGLFGHLARRDVERAGLVLERLADVAPEQLIQRTNPLVQLAACLVAVATGPSATPADLDDRLKVLATNYPGLPDGPVILARRRWSLARSPEDRAETLALFREGFRRGVPVYAAALAWLAEGLAALGDGSPEVSGEAVAAASLARSADTTQCFTHVVVNEAGEGA